MIEPLSLKEARKQLELPDSDDAHDVHLYRLIRMAREQWEHDTDSAVLTQSLTMYLDDFSGDCICLPKKPIQSVTTIKYYDSTNAQQTLSTNIYSLDAPSRKVWLAYQQQWPNTLGDRWDNVEVIYVAGYTSQRLVPAIAKQAMLLLVSYYFDANRGDNDRSNDLQAYERLAARFMRTSYP